MSLQNEYELVIILRPDIDDATATTAIERVEKAILMNRGTLLDTDDWGNRKMAYTIQGQSKGHYVLLNFLGEASAIAEIERTCRLVEPIIRFMTSRVADAVDVPARLEEAEEVRRLKAEEIARRRAEEEEQKKAEQEEARKKAQEEEAEEAETSDEQAAAQA